MFRLRELARGWSYNLGSPKRVALAVVVMAVGLFIGSLAGQPGIGGIGLAFTTTVFAASWLVGFGMLLEARRLARKRRDGNNAGPTETPRRPWSGR